MSLLDGLYLLRSGSSLNFSRKESVVLVEGITLGVWKYTELSVVATMTFISKHVNVLELN